MKKFSSDKLAILSIFVIILFFFLIQLGQGRLPIPADSILGLYHPWRDQIINGYDRGRFPVKNSIATDPVLQTYPWRKLVIDNIKNAQIPLWNPYSFSGYPLLANVQSAPFQILNIFFFLFPFNIAWIIQVILPVLLVSLFMYLFLKNLKLDTIAAVFGSIVLPFTGFFVSWQQWGTIISSAMWLPLTLLAVSKLFTKLSPIWFIVLTFGVSQSFFGGHLQTAFYVVVAIVFYTVFHLYNTKNFKSSLTVFISISLGILTTSIQMLPALEFINLSQRAADQGFYPGRLDWFIPIKHIVQIFSPDFFGNPTTYNYTGIWNYGEFVSFIGIIPLMLIAYAFFGKNRNVIFFSLLVFTTFVFGFENPFSKIPYNLNIPFVATIQPSRIIFLLVFSLAVLSSVGFNNFLKEKSFKKNYYPSAIMLGAIIALVIFTFTIDVENIQVVVRNLVLPFTFTTLFLLIIYFNSISFLKKYVGFLLIVLTIAELFRFGYKYLPFSKSSWIYPNTKVTDFLEAQEKPFRVMINDRRILHPNTSSIYKIEAVSGYDPLYLADYAQLANSWDRMDVEKPGSFNRIVTPTQYNEKFLDFLNVKYILSFEEIQSENFKKVEEDGQTKIIQNKNSLPRAFFVEEVVQTSSREEELTKFFDQDSDLAKIAFSKDFKYQKKQLNSTVNFVSYQDQQFKLDVNVDKEAVLVVGNVFYPGWKAYVDGRQVDVKRVNYMFQSVLISEGSHQVELKFRPHSFYNGLYISAGSVIAAILLALYLWRRKFQ